MDYYQEYIINPILEQLAPWQGGRAMVWGYTPSHDQLHLRFSREDTGTNECLYLICEACTTMCGPFRWEPFQITVYIRSEMSASTRANTIAHPGKLVVADTFANFYLNCHTIRAVSGDTYADAFGALSKQQ